MEKTIQQNYSTKQYLKVLYVLLFMSLVVIFGFFTWQRYQKKQETAAQQDIVQAVYYFEADNFAQALRNNRTHAGFLDIIKAYGTTKTANLAHFYAGICYMRQQNYEQAIQQLKQFQATDYLSQARAWALIGDAYTEQQDYIQATEYYLKASHYNPNTFFTPTYLEKAALAYEAQQDHQGALRCYQRIIQEFPKAELYEEATKHASRLEALAYPK